VTQADLARQIGVTQTSISNWEVGRVRPRPQEAERLSAILRQAADPDAAETTNAYGTWVTDRRAELGLTREQLAARSGISLVQIYNIEAGRTLNPRDRTRQAISEILAQTPPPSIESAVKEDVEIVGVGDLTDFNPYDREDIPSEPGVYVFYDVSNRPIYVGQASNIRERVANSHTGHVDKFWFRPPIVETASFVRVSDEVLRRKLEQTLIKFLKSNAVINKKGVER
jgi:transcriptional regulator with XRE-family HTH domain